MLSLLFVVGVALSDNNISADQVHKVIERSLPFIEKEGAAWIAEHKCASCHQVPFMVWSLAAARERGIPVDAKKFTEWSDWTLDFCGNSRSTKSKEKDGGGLDTAGQVILVHRYSTPTTKQEKSLHELAEYLVKMQQSDGSWQPGGQLPGQRRPKNETMAVTTGWTLMALASLKDRPHGFDQIRTRALDWLKKVDSNVSNEWLVVRFLLAHQFDDAETQKRLHGELLKDQNADGGWSWIRGQKSDALATGQSLYALGLSEGSTDQAVNRARKFLLETQEADGAWAVPGTKNGKMVATSRYWGTCWAVIGLCETLPQASSVRR